MFPRMLASIVLALLVSMTALAQDTAKPSDDDSKTKAVTGCLQKGDQADQFSITGENGKTWDLSSTTVKLADHQVTVTGSPTREAKAEEKKEGQVENAGRKERVGELRVTDLKMVSPNCTK